MGGIFPDDLRDFGSGGRADRVGGNPPCSPSEYGQGRRSTFASGRWAVGPYGMDYHGQGDAQQGGRTAALRAGPAQRQISCVDQQVALDSDGVCGAGNVSAGRVVLPVVGIFLPDGVWAAFDLAGEFRYAYVGIAAVSDRRHLDKQLLGGHADVRRRLAQQSPRGAAGGAAWAGMV